MMSGVAPGLSIQFAKRRDGAVVLRCVRADGSATWQRQDGRQAMFFPFHDLRHYAVETVLGFSRGFFGLIAHGWEIDETGGKGARGALPAEAVLVEHIVGLLDRERVGGAAPVSADELNAQLAMLSREGRVSVARTFTAGELDAVRRRADELQDAWARLESGATLELHFPPTAGADVARSDARL